MTQSPGITSNVICLLRHQGNANNFIVNVRQNHGMTYRQTIPQLHNNRTDPDAFRGKLDSQISLYQPLKTAVNIEMAFEKLTKNVRTKGIIA